MSSQEGIVNFKYHAQDRFSHKEYMIEHASYQYIMDMIKFYHESIYLFPDSEKIRAAIWHEDHWDQETVPINHLVFD